MRRGVSGATNVVFEQYIKGSIMHKRRSAVVMRMAIADNRANRLPTSDTGRTEPLSARYTTTTAIDFAVFDCRKAQVALVGMNSKRLTRRRTVIASHARYFDVLYSDITLRVIDIKSVVVVPLFSADDLEIFKSDVAFGVNTPNYPYLGRATLRLRGRLRRSTPDE